MTQNTGKIDPKAALSEGVVRLLGEDKARTLAGVIREANTLPLNGSTFSADDYPKVRSYIITMSVWQRGKGVMPDKSYVNSVFEALYQETQRLRNA